MNQVLKITHYTTVNSLGTGLKANLDALQQKRSGLSSCDFSDCHLETWIGQVALEQPVDGALAQFDCRNNRLALAGMQADGFAEAIAAARQRYGAHRIGVFMGTSTSGIQQTERAYKHRDLVANALPKDFNYQQSHNTFSVAWFTQQYLQLQGPAVVISTACSSSAKVFASASRYIQAGLCDAAIVGGVDSLCLTTLLGFNSLELVSQQKCRPWDGGRNGINIGESAGYALLEKPNGDNAQALELLGYGESSDAYHMSTPHPQGEGAALAMQRALETAELQADKVDYINLHGTATQSNDSAEDHAVVQVFGTFTPCSSSKGWTGHTLGAAGITEAVFCFLAMENNFMPGTLNTTSIDPALSAQVLLDNKAGKINITMSNSFGFGGSNCSLLFGKAGISS
ncbi:MAG: beta-ketoacyl-[acyl-carrier-protein] synthase family protein [Gammaproteobacteria bacterium]|nr:beta-ketoacyl-[acyl-carrier-protein] synthase family protein [Gammaproteobacteria bacterium]MDH5800335.1 beta-ketoacyl-[acyl-carrier-protein] synthase family protein [Gammaproteobacteria bacterium]